MFEDVLPPSKNLDEINRRGKEYADKLSQVEADLQSAAECDPNRSELERERWFCRTMLKFYQDSMNSAKKLYEQRKLRIKEDEKLLATIQQDGGLKSREQLVMEAQDRYQRAADEAGRQVRGEQ